MDAIRTSAALAVLLLSACTGTAGWTPRCDSGGVPCVLQYVPSHARMRGGAREPVGEGFGDVRRNRDGYAPPLRLRGGPVGRRAGPAAAQPIAVSEAGLSRPTAVINRRVGPGPIRSITFIASQRTGQEHILELLPFLMPYSRPRHLHHDHRTRSRQARCGPLRRAALQRPMASWAATRCKWSRCTSRAMPFAYDDVFNMPAGPRQISDSFWYCGVRSYFAIRWWKSAWRATVLWSCARSRRNACGPR
jgi:hypothetical protein